MYVQQTAEQETLGVTRSGCLTRAHCHAALPLARCSEKELAGCCAEAADLAAFQMRPELMVVLLQQGVELPNGGSDAHCAVVLQQHAMRHACDPVHRHSLLQTSWTAPAAAAVQQLQARCAASLTFCKGVALQPCRLPGAGQHSCPAASSAKLFQSKTDVIGL